MIWCAIGSLSKNKKLASADIVGPYEDIEQMQQSVAERIREIRSEGLVPCVIPFELCSDDVPEALHELTN